MDITLGVISRKTSEKEKERGRMGVWGGIFAPEFLEGLACFLVQIG